MLDLAQYTFDVIQYPLVWKPEHPQPLANYVGVARLIVRPRLVDLVYGAITFDYQISFSTKKVCYVITKLMLATKLETH